MTSKTRILLISVERFLFCSSQPSTAMRSNLIGTRLNGWIKHFSSSKYCIKYIDITAIYANYWQLLEFHWKYFISDTVVILAKSQITGIQSRIANSLLGLGKPKKDFPGPGCDLIHIWLHNHCLWYSSFS